MGMEERDHVQDRPWQRQARCRSYNLDKTGTITSGEPKVTDIIPASGITEEELLRMAYGWVKVLVSASPGTLGTGGEKGLFPWARSGRLQAAPEMEYRVDGARMRWPEKPKLSVIKQR